MPVKKRLTDDVVAELPIKRKRYLVWDTVVPNLAVRVGKARKTYVMVARFETHTSRRSLGTVGKITVDVARQRAQRLHTQLQGEVDTTVTFKEVAEKFYHHIERLKRWEEVVRMIDRELKPWMQKPIASITKKDVIAALDRKKGTPSAAHHLLANMRRLFNFAIARDILEASPCDRIDARQLIGQKAIRTRVLTDDALKKIWRAAHLLSPDYRDAVHLLMLTGCRKGEVSLARRSEIDLDTRTWTLSGDRTKQGAQHVVPLAPQALAIIKRRMAATGEGDDDGDDYLFDRPLRGWSKVKAKRERPSWPHLDWTLHDIRRTFRTRLSSLRVPEHVAELAIGHSKKSLQRVYNQYAYATELREAFDAWDSALEAIIQAPNDPVAGISLQGEVKNSPVPGAKSILAAS